MNPQCKVQALLLSQLPVFDRLLSPRYIHDMSDTLKLRVSSREKETWQKVADAVGEDLSKFARMAVRQRVQAVQARHGSPWDDLLGSVNTDAPPATNQNVRKAMRSKRP